LSRANSSSPDSGCKIDWPQCRTTLGAGQTPRGTPSSGIRTLGPDGKMLASCQSASLRQPLRTLSWECPVLPSFVPRTGTHTRSPFPLPHGDVLANERERGEEHGQKTDILRAGNKVAMIATLPRTEAGRLPRGWWPQFGRRLIWQYYAPPQGCRLARSTEEVKRSAAHTLSMFHGPWLVGR
jgi:hypothetical protein